MYKYIAESWKKNRRDPVQKQRLLEWRREADSVRVDKPTRLDRARSLGYKAKQGIIIVRERVQTGGRMRPRHKGGRRSKAMRRKKVLKQSFQAIAEQRAQKNYPNMEVLNSYFVGRDKDHIWTEVILVDLDHPRMKEDFGWMVLNRNRALRGKTSAQRKARGIVRNRNKKHH